MIERFDLLIIMSGEPDEVPTTSFTTRGVERSLTEIFLGRGRTRLL